MLRVLLITDEMEAGGTQRQIVTFCKAVDRSRVQPTVWYFANPSFLLDELRLAGIETRCIAKRPGFDPGFVLRLRSALAASQFDVVHAFAISAEWWTCVARTLLVRKPALLSSIRGRYAWYSRLHWRLKALVSLASFAVVANSRAAADFAIERGGVTAAKIRIVPNGVDPSRLAARSGAQAERKTALFVGRLVWEKNVDCLLRALARVPAGRRPTLLIAGDGPLRETLQARSRELDVATDVEWLGQVADVGPLYARADFAVQPSLSESLSNAVIEAMMCGVPVLATAVGGNSELIDQDRTGLLVASDDDAALAVNIQRLTDDGELRHRLATAARSQAEERFSASAMARAMCDIYAAAAARR